MNTNALQPTAVWPRSPARVDPPFEGPVHPDAGNGGLTRAAEFVQHAAGAIPAWMWVTAACAVVLAGRRRAWRRRDSVRFFDGAQRHAARTRAGHRCEYSARWTPWARCSRPAQEADHFFPWSRGGATTTANLVASCRWHNQAKGARQPTAVTAWVIAARRRAYFPPGERRRPGQWYSPLRART